MNRAWGNWVLYVLGLVLPSPCLSCEGPTTTKCPHLGLCVACRGRLSRPGAACHLCGEPIATALIPPAYRCGRCRRHPPAFDRLVAAYLYRQPLDAVVQHLKYRRLAYLGRHLAMSIAMEAGDALIDGDLVTAVPLHWRRQLSRGFNQASEIAYPLARSLGIEMRRTLRRTHATRPQSALSRTDRQRNPTGVFSARPNARLAGRTVLLVDDVMTTGATLHAAAAVLKAAGAQRVIGVVAGWTPPPQQRGGSVGRVLETPSVRRP